MGTGGLIGDAHYILVTINSSYATGNIKGDIDVGGLVGTGSNTKINNSYAQNNLENVI